jgi:preprotein translocase subunit YajC
VIISDVLISSAWAAAPAAQQPDPIMSLLPFIIIFVLFYFMLIRPQMKRAKEQKKMIEALQKGDEVVTSGGVLGKVTKVSEQYVSLEIADNVVIQVQKQTVQTVLPKGTIKGNA